ncbi:MAG: penicillin-binding protein 2 [Dehalococcoidia bacterium]|nr:MAG: penicillin-binding protein 2 [Dehalococcoidia bacterium]
MNTSREHNLTWRHRVIALLVFAMFSAAIVRLYTVQIRDHEKFVKEAAITRQGAVSIPAPRGAVLDATGYPLATSIDTWDVYIDRVQWGHQPAAARETAQKLGAFFGLNPDDLLRLGMESRGGDILVQRQMDYARGLALRTADLYGVRLEPSQVRVYPEGNIAGQLLGFVGRDGKGLWGVEADFDHYLRGKEGILSTERDALGRPIAFSARHERAAVGGGEVQLTIDRFIQAIAERALEDAMKKYHARSGQIIVMDPHTGAVLAMASRPSIRLGAVNLDDPNLSDLVRDRPITDLYEPGSVMKILTTAMAIDQGLVTPESTYNDTGAVEVSKYRILNWDFSANGNTTVRKYLQKSLNTGSVWLGQKIGPDKFYDYVKAFGLGESTHLGLSGEAEGTYRTPSDPNWYAVDLATNSYGQGLATTPLAMLTAVNSMANKGVLMRPYVVSKIVTKNDVRTFEPVRVRQVVSPQTAETMMGLLHDVVDGVEFHGAQVKGYQVAGKTGTTLVSIPTGYDIDSTIASFAGFIPAQDPKVSILIKIDQPTGGLNLGGQVAAPIFSTVAEQVMKYYAVAPAAPQQNLVRAP